MKTFTCSKPRLLYLFSPDSEEKFFVLPKAACSDCERLQVFKDVLISNDPLKAKLNECLEVSWLLVVACSVFRHGFCLVGRNN